MVLHKYFSALLLSVIFVGAAFGPAAAHHASQGQSALFIPLKQVGMAREELELAVTRGRRVGIDWTTLQTANPGKKIQLNLFEDTNLNTVISSVETKNGITTWIGQVENEPLAQVFVVSSKGQVALDVNSPNGFYQVRPAGAGVYDVQQIDQSAYPEEMLPIEIGPGQIASLKAKAAKAAETPTDQEDGGTIDVLVLYTPQSRTAAGGETAMTNLVNLAVAETNQSYANSSITQRLRLVKAQEISYTESGAMDNDLVRLQDGSDGYLNEAQTLRETYGADVVSLIIEATQYCGIAYLMNDVSPYFEEYAYSVVARSCATGYYSFAHELGHNMGARHDWYVDTSTYPDSYGHGYVNIAGRWRTIMAYNNECSANGVNCTRLQYWSNPAILRSSVPMGVAGGTNATCQFYDRYHPQCDADDHRTLNDAAFTVANFRQAQNSPTGVPVNLANYTVQIYLPITTRQ